MVDILTMSYDNGSTQSLMGPIESLQDRGLEVLVVTPDDAKCRSKLEFAKNKLIIESHENNPVTVEDMHNLLEGFSPRLVLTGTSSPRASGIISPEQAIVRAARDRSLPVISVLDFPNNVKTRFGIGEAENYIPDLICVPDGKTFEQLTAMNPGCEIKYTGNPHFDLILRLVEQYKQDNVQIKVRESLGISDGTKHLIFFSGPMRERGEHIGRGFDQYDALREFLDSALAMQNNYDLFLEVRLHPADGDIYKKDDPAGRVKQIADDSKYDGLNILVHRKGITTENVFACDIIVAMYSTVLWEAAAMASYQLAEGLDVSYPISLQPGLDLDGPIGDCLPTNAEGVTYPVYERNSVRSVMEDFLNDGPLSLGLRSKLVSGVSSVDGKATERVVDLVLKYL